jgi:hypothetical protein
MGTSVQRYQTVGLKMNTMTLETALVVARAALAAGVSAAALSLSWTAPAAAADANDGLTYVDLGGFTVLPGANNYGYAAGTYSAISGAMFANSGIGQNGGSTTISPTGVRSVVNQLSVNSGYLVSSLVGNTSGGFSAYDTATGYGITMTPDGGFQTGHAGGVVTVLSPTGDATIGKDLTVNGKSVLKGQVNFGSTNSTLITTDGTISLHGGSTTIDGASGTISVANGVTRIDGNTGRITTGGGLSVQGGTTTDTLTVTGQTTVHNFAVANGSTVSMGGNVVHDVAAPVVGTDAANKAYVDTGLNQLRQEDRRLGSGIAMAAAIPHTTVLPGEKIAFGVDWANYDGLNAIGADGAVRLGQWGPVSVQGNAGFATSPDGGGRVLGKAGLRFGF